MKKPKLHLKNFVMKLVYLLAQHLISLQKTVVKELRISFESALESPNTITTKAMNEYYEMKSNPEKYKRYSNFKKAMNEALNET